MCDDKKIETSKDKKIDKAFMNDFNELENAFGNSFLNEIDKEESEDDDQKEMLAKS